MHAVECASEEASEREYARFLDLFVTFFSRIFFLDTYSPILVMDQQGVDARVLEVHPEVSTFLDDESRVPWWGLLRCIALGAIVLMCSLFKGGGRESVIHVTCGGQMCACLSNDVFIINAAY